MPPRRLCRLHLPLLALLAALAVAALSGCETKPPLVTGTRTVGERRPPAPRAQAPRQRPLPSLGLDHEPELRILLSRRVSGVEVQASGGFVALDAEGRPLARYGGERRYSFFQNRRSPERLEVVSEGLRGGAKTRAALKRLPFPESLTLQPLTGGVLTVNGKRYRGRLKLWREDDHFSCLNLLPMELYLRGVVPHEIGNLPPSGFEAMKAQAVASRTYAVQRLIASRERAWDMVDTVADQVYRGAEEETPAANRAIDATRGQLLFAGAEPAEIYYASTCGGATVAIEEVWKHDPVPHLRMVRDVDEQGRAWCRSSKLYRWSHRWSAKQLGQILRAYLPPAAGLPANTEVGYLKDIAVTERTPEGRAKRLVVTTDRGEFVVQGDRIRSALKRDLEGNALRSIFFELKTERDKQGRLVRVTATGAGWGHGIGMCQVGAIGRSTAGQRYDEILSAYYPGTRLARRWH